MSAMVIFRQSLAAERVNKTLPCVRAPSEPLLILMRFEACLKTLACHNFSKLSAGNLSC
jgi:hypothetical protein